MVGRAVGTKAELYAKIAATVDESVQQFPEVGRSFQVRVNCVNLQQGLGQLIGHVLSHRPRYASHKNSRGAVLYASFRDC